MPTSSQAVWFIAVALICRAEGVKMLPLFRRVTLGVGLALVLSLVVLRAQGADPWIGTWTFVSGHVSLDPTPQITYTLEKNGLNFVRKNAAGQDEWTAQPDGKTYPWTYTPVPTPSATRANQVVLERLEKGIVEFTSKSDGKVLSKTRITVSADGKEYSTIGTPEGGSAGSPLYWTRSGGPTDPANPLVGTWKRNDDRGLAANPQPPLRVESEGDNAYRWTTGAADTSFQQVKLDGKEYPLGQGGGTIISKRINDRAFESTTTGSNGTVTIARCVLSADGREVTLTRINTRTGATAFKNSSELKYRKQ
jgi:hypothetical protein